MSKGPQTPIEIDQKIALLAWQGYGPAQIHRHLFPFGPDSDGHVSEKTVQRRVRELRPTDSSGPWSFLDSEPERAALVLDVVAFVIDSTDGRYRPSRDDVAWFERVRIAVPGIPDRWAAFIGWSYKRITTEPDPDTRALDLTVGFAPWRSGERAAEWADALGRWEKLLDTTDPWVLDVLEFLSFISLRPELPSWAAAWADTQIDTLASRPPSTQPDGIS